MPRDFFGHTSQKYLFHEPFSLASHDNDGEIAFLCPGEYFFGGFPQNQIGTYI
jgi:hypothetical protein